MRSESNNVNLLLRYAHMVYLECLYRFTHESKHTMPYNMATCTWWPQIEKFVTPLHLIDQKLVCYRYRLSFYFFRLIFS